MTNGISVVERGCGTRVTGGIYAECGCGEGGKPLEDFLICPPLKIDPQAFGLTPRGVQLYQRNGVWHILDWVGSQHYPNVADFVEEARLFGISRRLAKTLDFAKLTPESRMLLVHARAYVENFHEYAEKWEPRGYGGYRRPDIPHPSGRCPKDVGEHNLPDPPLMCSGVFWQDIEGGQGESRLVTRTMPSFTYTAACRPEDVEPQYHPAIFASFPVHCLAVITGANGEHEEGLKAAQESSLTVSLEVA